MFFTPDRAEDTPVYQRSALGVGQTIAGPAAIDQLDATTIVHPGDSATVDSAGNLIVELAA